MKNYLKLIKNNLELIKKNFHKKIHSNQQLRIFIALNLFYEMEKLMYLKKINHENYYKSLFNSSSKFILEDVNFNNIKKEIKRLVNEIVF